MTSDSYPAFADLALAAPVLDALARIGYERPTPIQAESIPPLLQGRDLLGTAQTGTGKTAAFALPLLSRLDMGSKSPQVLVLTPTRELAIQVAEAFQTYAAAMRGFHVLPVYGGQNISVQLRQLRRGAHVIVGTPGRVMDHLRRGTLQLDDLETVVLDEADEMLRMGFIDDVTWILEHTPEERQVALFSATMPPPIRRVANKYLRAPAEVKIVNRTTTVERTEQKYWIVSGVHKLDALTRILEAESFDGIIVFVRTKTLTAELAEKLEARGYAAAAINGDMNQQQRERTIERLKNGKTDILVATDVAARGIDVTRISHVINYDIPYDAEAYVHRIGRTGRAGRSGKAILFVAPRERRLLRAIEKSTRQAITPMELPTREQVNSRRIEQFKVSITEAMEGEQMPFFHDLVQQYLDETDTDPQQVAAALACLAQRDRPLLLADTGKAERPPVKDTGDRGTTKKPAEKRRIESAEDTEKRQTTPRHKRREETEGIDMERFRIAVGRIHDVKPGDIVGAIANEADIDSVYIGRIALYDDYSTVELPAGMPREVFQHLKKVYVRGQPLRIESLDKAEKRDKKKSVRKKTGARKPGAKKPGGKKSARTKPAGRKNTGKGKPKPPK